MTRNLVVLGLSILLGFLYLGGANGLAVMSVDIGSEWMKVAIVSPGVPMEIALNKESKRKTPAVIAFREDERFFGEDAQGVGIRFPKNSFSYILDLLGKSIDNPIVSLYQKRFPYHEIIADVERNTIGFRMDDGTIFTPEELLAQLLHKAKEMAENSAGQKIKEAVITVPGFFNQAERRAMIQAAELADIKVLQLINDYTAVALNYGIFHRNEFNDTTQYIMFYDMGASSTTATVVSYQNVKTKERGYVETHPQVSILGVGYDRTLGGLEVQTRLQQHLAEEFDKLKKTKSSVFESPRAMAKLFKEAGRVKNVLSANADHYAQIEGLLDEQDFKLQVTREKLEELAADVMERVTAPIQMALNTSQLTMSVVSHVILVGAATRMPKIQEMLQNYLNTELSKNINTDEAAALGGVYKAADLSSGFKVKKFITKDGVLFPIQIVFDKSNEEKSKQVRRTLFSKMNAYPQKKIITFNKRQGDFDFSVGYADLDHIPPHEIPAIGNLNLSTVSLTGVTEAFEKHQKEGAESKGIKAHFAMDDSGLLELVNIELVSEKSTAVEKDEGSDEPEAEKVEEPPKEDIKPVREEPEAPPAPETPEKQNSTNATKPEEPKPSNQTDKSEKKVTLVILKEPIPSSETKYGPQALQGPKLKESIEKIKKLELKDLEKVRRETALNTLESFVIDTQQHLQFDEYKSAAASGEIEKINEACSATSDWLYEDGFGKSADVYEEKLNDLKKLTSDLYERVFEHRERPEVLAGMETMLNGSKFFLNNMKNISGGENKIFTAIEIETLEKTINDTHEFHQTVIKTVAETKSHEPIKFKVRDIANKMALLDREVKYLVNKAKIWKPTVEEKVPEGSGSDNQTESAPARNSTSPVDSEESVTIDSEEETITEGQGVDSATTEKPEPPKDEGEKKNDEHLEL
ncbi:hypoxia up-regulated protein 1 isoform X2 [Diachasma alloeum]|uniref:hypoxia up-regulated protein 1 isoform X2 n=1 Tax=Diachasma alloeum TaxID=454923 RepID=UPI0007384638|nr:hypoxia up-regulated protein 1 isoform X2 [Diachasma alloeum]